MVQKILLAQKQRVPKKRFHPLEDVKVEVDEALLLVVVLLDHGHQGQVPFVVFAGMVFKFVWKKKIHFRSIIFHHFLIVFNFLKLFLLIIFQNLPLLMFVFTD
jgi:hypothetical protein